MLEGAVRDDNSGIVYKPPLIAVFVLIHVQWNLRIMDKLVQEVLSANGRLYHIRLHYPNVFNKVCSYMYRDN